MQDEQTEDPSEPEEEIETIAPQYRFEDGKAVNIGKPIFNYKIGTEYASGGAGGISTVDDYIKFLEGLRTYKLLKLETVKLMMTDRLTDEQKRTYWTKDTHGYGLGVRCPKGDKIYNWIIEPELFKYLLEVVLLNSKKPSAFFNVLKENNIERCYYGHLHGGAIKGAVNEEKEGIKFRLVSADFLEFCPYLVNLE